MAYQLPMPRIRPWSRGPARIAGDFGVFRVETHAMKDGAGNPKKDAVTLACPDWVNVIARATHRGTDHLVLVWQHRFGTDAASLELPGGCVEKNESPEAAALRELAEETGFVADAVKLISKVEPNPAIQGNTCFTFVAEGARKTRDVSFDEMEECETVLVPETAIEELLDRGEIRHALCVVGLETYLRRRNASKP